MKSGVTLYIELTEDERKITTILNDLPSIHIDELYFKSGLSSSAVATALLTLEMQGVIDCMPGKMYKMC